MKDIAFTILALAIGASNTLVFVLIKLNGKVYVYEPNPYILYLEVALAGLFTVWAMVRLFKTKKGA